MRMAHQRYIAIDDLESFLWVLLVSVLQWCSYQPGVTREQDLYNALHTTDLANLLNEKISCMTTIEDMLGAQYQTSQAILVVFPLLQNWFVLVREYRRKVTKHCESAGKAQDLQTLCAEAYKAYLEEGFKGLELISYNQPINTYT